MRARQHRKDTRDRNALGHAGPRKGPLRRRPPLSRVGLAGPRAGLGTDGGTSPSSDSSALRRRVWRHPPADLRGSLRCSARTGRGRRCRSTVWRGDREIAAGLIHDFRRAFGTAVCCELIGLDPGDPAWREGYQARRARTTVCEPCVELAVRRAWELTEERGAHG